MVVVVNVLNEVVVYVNKVGLVQIAATLNVLLIVLVMESVLLFQNILQRNVYVMQDGWELFVINKCSL